jgi:uncharacterized protein
MRRDDVLLRLRQRRDLLEGVGVSELFLYGSVARDQAEAGSDVDLLVESANPTFSIFDLVRVKALCQQILGVAADVHHHGGLKRAETFRRNIAADLIRVF